MHMGEMKFKQKGREEQAEADGSIVSWTNLIILFLFSLFFVTSTTPTTTTKPHTHPQRNFNLINEGSL